MPGISDWACSGLAKTAAVTTVRQYLATLMIGVGGGGIMVPYLGTDGDYKALGFRSASGASLRSRTRHNFLAGAHHGLPWCASFHCGTFRGIQLAQPTLIVPACYPLRVL